MAQTEPKIAREQILNADTRVRAARQIRPYIGPSYLIEGLGDESDADDLSAINELIRDGLVIVIESELRGWGPYTHIVSLHTPSNWPQLNHYLVAFAQS